MAENNKMMVITIGVVAITAGQGDVTRAFDF